MAKMSPRTRRTPYGGGGPPSPVPAGPGGAAGGLTSPGGSMGGMAGPEGMNTWT